LEAAQRAGVVQPRADYLNCQSTVLIFLTPPHEETEMMKKRQIVIAIGIAALGLLTQGQALAQADYPNKPIKLIVAFPPGGTSDVMGRLMAEELSKVLKQQVVVENIGGAGGVVGTDRAVKLPADGYTIIQTGVGQNAVAHGLDPNLKYNSLTDFIHLTQVHSGPNVLLVHPAQPFKTVKELVEYAKKNPGKLDYGSTKPPHPLQACDLGLANVSDHAERPLCCAPRWRAKKCKCGPLKTILFRT
jgi:hypothetical protein